MTRRLCPALLALALLLAPSPGRAQDRQTTLEHNGSLSLFATLGAEYSALVVTDCDTCTDASGNSHPKSISGLNSNLDVGGSIAVGQSGSEILLRGRFTFLSPAWGGSVLLGYRKYFGKDEFKTFVSFDLMGTFRPVKTVGARAAFGVMWDFSPIMGLWVDAGGTFGLGVGRRFGGELNVGFQARSYLLE